MTHSAIQWSLLILLAEEKELLFPEIGRYDPTADVKRLWSLTCFILKVSAGLTFKDIAASLHLFSK